MNTHDVLNQSTPFTDVDLYTSNRPLRDALVFNLDLEISPDDESRLRDLGRLSGSAAMQEHARQANVHTR
jgi:putative acyl-CoA dehydrogenase